MDFTNSGVYPYTNGNSAFPGTTLTGPIIGGNVMTSDGTSNLAGVGETTGTANTGVAVMGQSTVITQASGVPFGTLVIPAQSQIINFKVMVTTAWTAGNTTMAIGTTGNSTYFTSSGAVQGNTTGLVTGITPVAGNATSIAHWDNVGNTDVAIQVTSGNTTGAGVGTLIVEYLQGINLAS